VTALEVRGLRVQLQVIVVEMCWDDGEFVAAVSFELSSAALEMSFVAAAAK
jgi:hypothetical protein